MSVPDGYVDGLINSLRRHDLTINEDVRKAFREVPREYFVKNKRIAYRDHPQPIPKNQTISAPHMYAMMLANEITSPKKGMDILEIGTGSGYGAALLAQAVKPGKVYSIERHKELVEYARSSIEEVENVDFSNLKIIHGDGTTIDFDRKFDRILVTASGPEIPESYKKHLKKNGRIIMPLEKNHNQWLTVITYEDGEPKIDWKFRVRFVPLVGEQGH